MRMRQQLIIVVAVVFATVAVGMNVYASTRLSDQRSQHFEQVMPVASVLDRGVLDPPRPRPADPQDTSTPPVYSNAPDDPHTPTDVCSEYRAGDAADPAFWNHGRGIAAFAAHIGLCGASDEPPGALVSERARPDVGVDGPPRSDRAEERRNTTHPSPPSSQDKGKSTSEKDR